MTNHPENLVAWLDDELPATEAEQITEHVAACPECRKRARLYTTVSDGLVEHRAASRRRWIPVAAMAAGIAATILLGVALWPREKPSIAKLEVPSRVPTQVSAPEFIPARPPVRRPVKRHQPAPAAPAPAKPVSYETVIRVSISADELFPPGAVPPGFEIYAEVALAADGTPRELRLFP